ncbi:hypothetical protein KCH_46630 [Kitasatospora cheerisanensis KCTC 2395]|uniref:Uncharacterized protein n=1 Tax=Kitasatospora cheerisanensis KCTC 2395 TaxID=1348663 RepID=A0A066YYQ9_9ACTN|nr:hypothetical protein KCH_46630 [Kitasatospora cheerisanensis KCTC 2395]
MASLLRTRPRTADRARGVWHPEAGLPIVRPSHVREAPPERAPSTRRPQ